MKYLMPLFVFVCVSFFIPLHVSAADAPITMKNWSSHPSVVSIRKIFNDVEDGIKKKIFTKSLDSTREEGEPARTYTKYSGSDKLIRKLVMETGSEDSSATVSHYYDDKGVLRFVFVQGGAVNGASVEYRIYFKGSERIWEMRTYTSKIQYTFPESWPDGMIVYDPAVLFTER